ncbi:site-specific integrase [Sphingobium cupriresistens]|uniref:site-specific integrase n=1 Tax=Sphingobium cupriresistens TaxID=1132417 RepID=UPI002E81E34C|nr:site-specific integrase [Sphingobium cupriresistens]
MWVTKVGHKRWPRGLSLRGSTFQYRVRVPVDLRKDFGCSHVKRSLGTDSPSLAVRLGRRMAVEIDALFEERRRVVGLAYETRLLASNDNIDTVSKSRPSSVAIGDSDGIMSPSRETESQPAAPTLSAIYQRYLDDPTRRRCARTMLAHATTRRVVEDIIGSATPIAEITRETCRDLFEVLRWLPVNYNKKYGDLSARDAAAMGKSDPQVRTINPTNLNAYMARFGSLLNWAVAEEYIVRNPSRGLQLAETVHPQDRRRPFAVQQLQRIFSAPVYSGCKDEQAGYAVPGSTIATGARYWVALLGLLSGARLNEICQLDVADIRLIEGVACLVISEDSATGGRDKSLKNKASARIVPVHPVLLQLGFMDFVDRKKRDGAFKLFDDLPAGAKGFRSVAFSRWFARFLVRSSASAPQTCYHSFRHGFRDAARNARIDRDIVLRLGGWTTGGGQSEAADNYGNGYHPRVLFEAISKIEYSGLNLTHLVQYRLPTAGSEIRNAPIATVALKSFFVPNLPLP